MANANPCTARSFELCCKDRVKFPMCSASLFSLTLSQKQTKNQLIQIKKPGGSEESMGPLPCRLVALWTRRDLLRTGRRMTELEETQDST